MAMGRAKEIVKRELMELDPADRAEIAEDALQSLSDTDYGTLSAAWEDEIQRRLAALVQGQAEPIPGDDVFRDIEAELQARRGQG
jgi:putative addiction module component (TIGR02574 family)